MKARKAILKADRGITLLQFFERFPVNLVLANLLLLQIEVATNQLTSKSIQKTLRLFYLFFQSLIIKGVLVSSVPDGSRQNRGSPPVDRNGRRVIIASGILIGIGLAGLLDTIIFHEILQWHHMVSNIVPPTSVEAIRFNIFMDGVFSAVTIIVIAAGALLLLSGIATASRRLIASRYFAGFVLFGFGLFNAYDGIVNHLIVGIHHAIDIPDPLFADLAWTASLGFAFVGAGIYLVWQKHTITSSAPADTAAA